MDMRLELVPVPVADVERAKEFYVEHLGFGLDHDVEPTEGVRVVQLTPPSSACSIVLSAGLTDLSAQPGSIRGLHLVVSDIDRAREELTGGGVDVGEINDLGGGVRMAAFADPDGNTWTLQELARQSQGRKPER